MVSWFAPRPYGHGIQSLTFIEQVWEELRTIRMTKWAQRILNLAKDKQFTGAAIDN